MTSHWKTMVAGIVIVSASIFVFVPETSAQSVPAGGRPATQRGAVQPKPTAAASNETYCIVEVDHDLQVVSKPKELKDLKKRLDDDYKTAHKAWQDAKKNKDTKATAGEEPKKKTVKELPGKSFKTQEKANEELQKMLADRDKSGDQKSRR